MTLFECVYCSLRWFTPLHYVKIRRILKSLCRQSSNFQLLDVGGRKSPYTINVNCDVHVVDLPRETEIQEELNLGLTDRMMEQMRRRRSNVKSIRLEDITRTTLEDESFDGVVGVEVIEHVPDDSGFVRQIYRILKPGGTLVLTTPNGEVQEKANPDHIREYSGTELESKLRECFEEVDVFYGERLGYLHRMSLKGWVTRNPLKIPRSVWIMFCALLANLLDPSRSGDSKRMNRLFAVARKTSEAGTGHWK